MEEPRTDGFPPEVAAEVIIEEAAEQAEYRSDAPNFQWAIQLRDFGTFWTHLPDGGRVLHLAPIARTPMGNVPMPPGIEARFSPQGWEMFQREVAAGGEKAKVQAVPAAAMSAIARPPGFRG